MSGAENGAERTKTRVERSGGGCAGLRKIGRSGAERERDDRAERVRSGERTKSAALATATADIFLFSLRLHVTRHTYIHT